MKSPLIDLFYIFILDFCVVLRTFCVCKTPLCDVIVGLFCDVTPRNQRNIMTSSIVPSTAREKRYPTCKISILFMALYTGYHVRKLGMVCVIQTSCYPMIYYR